jgi:thiopeptide-type bacteriocin biosynthesis protein
VEEGRAGRLAFDTYERELERYGGLEGIELTERVFHADSDTVLELLSMFEPGDRGAEERWRMGLCGTSMLLPTLGSMSPSASSCCAGCGSPSAASTGSTPKRARAAGRAGR